MCRSEANSCFFCCYFFFLNQIFNLACLTQKSLIQTNIFCTGVSVKCYNRGRSFKRFRLFKIVFVASVRRATPRPGLWCLHPHKERFFFLHPYWHHWLLHPVHSGSLNAAVCVGQMRLVRGLISFAVSLRNAFSSPARCRRRVTLLLIHRDSSAASPQILTP